MKQKKLILTIAFAGFVSFFSFAQNEQAKMEIMMKMLSLKNALIAKDSLTLSKVLADDVTYGHTIGLMQTKAELIRSVMSYEQDYKSIDPSEMNVRIFDNAGIVNMNSRVSMLYKKQPLNVNMKVTFVWIKKNSDWQLVARQAVKTD